MESFNYEDIFMGVMEGKNGSYKRTFRDDYRLKRLIEAVKRGKHKMLDIGCGGGILTESLHYYYPRAKTYGCDVSREAIRYARKHGSGKVIYSIIRKNKLPYKDNFFDVCICLDVMEHIPDVNFLLKEVKRVLKKNGQFFLLVPCEGQPLTHTWFSQKLNIGSKMTFKRYGHIHPEFTHNYIKDLLNKHGFEIKKTNYSEHILYQIISLIVYFIPREIMDLVLGNKVNLYTDAGVIRFSNSKERLSFIMLFRNFWFSLIKFLRFITAWELELFKHVPFTAWKLIVLSQVKK